MGGDSDLLNDLPIIYVINLKRRRDRWHKIKSQLNNTKLKYYRINAVDGNDITTKDKIKFVSYSGLMENRFGLKLTNGAIALAITFYKLCYNMYKNKINTNDSDYFIIFEDDVTIADDFVNRLSSVVSSLSNVDFDILYLGHHGNIDVGSINRVNDYVYKLKKNTQINGTFGLLIPKNKCKKIISKMFPLKYQIDTQFYIDNELSKYVIYPNNLIFSEPSNIYNSDIQM
jgi:GR25 family glycosyltransferase involved in LPS biosynthesis